MYTEYINKFFWLHSYPKKNTKYVSFIRTILYNIIKYIVEEIY